MITELKDVDSDFAQILEPSSGMPMPKLPDVPDVPSSGSKQ